jgi:hypothetical protein
MEGLVLIAVCLAGVAIGLKHELALERLKLL